MAKITSHHIKSQLGRLFAREWSPQNSRLAPIVMIHDSLGCVELWRNFPELLSLATGRRVIAYDRLGFGQSDAFPGKLPPTFVWDEASLHLQPVLEHFKVDAFIPFGHSVGGGMAAMCGAYQQRFVKGIITEAAQAFIEDRTLDGIRVAEKHFAAPSQLAKLSKYHGAKAEWVLRSWIDTWTAPSFRDWTLADKLPRVSAPILCIHGEQDEYGSLSQPQLIAETVSGPSKFVALPGCAHVPHRERELPLLDLVTEFLKTHDI